MPMVHVHGSLCVCSVHIHDILWGSAGATQLVLNGTTDSKILSMSSTALVVRTKLVTHAFSVLGVPLVAFLVTHACSVSSLPL